MSDVFVKTDLDKLLYGLLRRTDLIEQWWDTPNAAFNNRSPIQTYQSGDEGRRQIRDYILQFCI